MGTVIESKDLDVNGDLIAEGDNTTEVAGRLWEITFTLNRYEWYSAMSPKVLHVPTSNYEVTKLQDGNE
jgi:hypothetical protein